MKQIFTILLLLTSLSLSAQQDFPLGNKFDVWARLNVKDSTLVVTYENKMSFAQMIWKNDFNIAAVFNQSDISASYLASPIVNEIYLVKKDLKTRKTSTSYFLRNDSSELNLHNYRCINRGEKLELNIKIQDKKLFQLILSNQFVVKGVFSLIDLGDIEDFSKKNKTEKLCQMLDSYSNASISDKTPIVLKGISWAFNRKDELMYVNGLPFGKIQQGKFSKTTMIYPAITNNSKLNILSFDELYRFTNKQYFEAKINIQ